MVDWWRDTDRGIPEYLEETLSVRHFVHHRSLKDWRIIPPSHGTNQDSVIKMPQSHKRLKYKGKGKGKVHPRRGYEGPEGE